MLIQDPPPPPHLKSSSLPPIEQLPEQAQVLLGVTTLPLRSLLLYISRPRPRSPSTLPSTPAPLVMAPVSTPAPTPPPPMRLPTPTPAPPPSFPRSASPPLPMVPVIPVLTSFSPPLLHIFSTTSTLRGRRRLQHLCLALGGPPN